MFDLKEADGFVYSNYFVVLHLRSSLHSFRSEVPEAQTVYMVHFPGVKLNPGRKDNFSREVCLGSKLQANDPCGELVGIGRLKLSIFSMGCLAAVLKQGLLLELQRPAYILTWLRI